MGKEYLAFHTIFDNKRFATDCEVKWQLSSSYFLEQFTLLKNISTLPNTCSKYTKNILDTIVF